MTIDVNYINAIAGKTILWGGKPKFLLARVIRMDGMLIKNFTYEEKLKGIEYFKRWISDNMFNVERVENDDEEVITYWVS